MLLFLVRERERERERDSPLREGHYSPDTGEDVVVNVTGHIQTIRVSDTQEFDEEVGGKSTQIITRLLLGGENCDPRNESNVE